MLLGQIKGDAGHWDSFVSTPRKCDVSQNFRGIEDVGDVGATQDKSDQRFVSPHRSNPARQYQIRSFL